VLFKDGCFWVTNHPNHTWTNFIKSVLPTAYSHYSREQIRVLSSQQIPLAVNGNVESGLLELRHDFAGLRREIRREFCEQQRVFQTELRNYQHRVSVAAKTVSSVLAVEGGTSGNEDRPNDERRSTVNMALE